MVKGSSKNPRKSDRNPLLAEGVRKYGRTAAASKRFRHPIIAKAVKANLQPKVRQPFDRVKAHNDKLLAAKFYPPDDVKIPLRHTRKSKTPVLRSSITPGTVVIILAGRFRGRRVVALKQLLPSGLLLVSGPMKINGVPLRRINPAYVIATSTKVDVSKVDVSKIQDALFAREGESKSSSYKGQFIPDKTVKKPLSPERKAAQTAVDTALLTAIKSVDTLSAYLAARFTLTNGQKPHLLKF